MLGRWQLFFPQPPPPGYPKGRSNRCQDDSLLLAREHPELTLVAGYLRREGEGEVWWGHFWCIDNDGRLIDTAPLAFGEGEPPELYVGFPVGTEEAAQAVADSPRRCANS